MGDGTVDDDGRKEGERQRETGLRVACGGLLGL